MLGAEANSITVVSILVGRLGSRRFSKPFQVTNCLILIIQLNSMSSLEESNVSKYIIPLYGADNNDSLSMFALRRYDGEFSWLEDVKTLTTQNQ